MAIPDLGELVEVELREAWDHEAHSFTPWLAKHLDQLSQKISLPLELEGVEVRVGSFSADILARNPLDESLVLIENQLEQSDHTHLGQIMTYLAGLEAKTVVWIAKGFREPHLSAIDWLNANTADEFSFFAVQVKVVRIGTSPIAPVFDVVARPNHWDQALHKIAAESGDRTELNQKRIDFWKHYLTQYPDDEKYCAASSTSHRWRKLADVGLTVIAYLSANEVGVYVRGMRGDDPTDVYEQLVRNDAVLAEKLGVQIGDDSRKYFFQTRFPADTSNRREWDRLCEWLKITADKYEVALREQPPSQ